MWLGIRRYVIEFVKSKYSPLAKRATCRSKLLAENFATFPINKTRMHAPLVSVTRSYANFDRFPTRTKLATVRYKSTVTMPPNYSNDPSNNPRRHRMYHDSYPSHRGQRDFGGTLDRRYRHDHNHDYDDGGAASRDRSNKTRHSNGISWSQVAAAAASAGAAQALKSQGRKGEELQVAAAAAASGAADAIIGSKQDKKSAVHVAQSAIVGLAISRLFKSKENVSG